jgi:hypothetical protein
MRTVNPQMKSKLIALTSRITGSTLVDGGGVIGLCYSQLLRRQPDEDGYGSYLRYLENGGSIDTIIQDFAESDEFRRVQSDLCWDLTPWILIPDVVRGLYLGLLSRAPDAEEAAEAARQLCEGAKLPSFIRSILISEGGDPHDATGKHSAVNGNQVIVMQTCDGPNYYPLLEEGRRANEAFALRNGYRYECFIGIKRGYFPWHACFNRIIMLQDMVRTGYRGWVFYLDADAYIYDQEFDLNQYLDHHADKALIAGMGGSTGHRWDLNDGAFLINLGHGDGREIIGRWHDHFLATPDDALRAAKNWEDVPSDQPRLHEILRNEPRLLDALLIEDRGVFNDYNSSFVRQALRGNGMSIDERLALMHRDLTSSAASVCADMPVAMPEITN